MATKKRKRRVGSIKHELLRKSKEAALAAVEIFNSPTIHFKSEIFIVLMNIAWTYLLHAYFRGQKIEYRYFQVMNGRRRFDRTKHGAHKYWELERCLNDSNSPLDRDTSNNLRFLIGIRHEIEHQMTSRIDDLISARFQACSLNYNHYLKKLFPYIRGIEENLAFSLQFSSISRLQVEELDKLEGLPGPIRKFILGFDGALSEDEYQSPRFAYRVLFVPKLANRKGQADEVIEFVKADSELAQQVNAHYTTIKEVERPKYLPGEIVRLMKSEGFSDFSMHKHTELWRSLDAKRDGKGFGVQIANTWYWYQPWIEEVRKYCQQPAPI
jgi:hypothetical protein